MSDKSILLNSQAAKSVQVIKKLQADNETLKADNKNLRQEKSCISQNLEILSKEFLEFKKRHNDTTGVVEKVTNLEKTQTIETLFGASFAGNGCIEQRMGQEPLLTNQLEEHVLKEKVQQIMVPKLSTILKKAQASNDIFAHEIKSLQTQLTSIHCRNQETTQAQTVSGDEDLNVNTSPLHHEVSSSLIMANLKKELAQVKTENEKLKLKLKEKENLCLKLQGKLSKVEQLEIENNVLKEENTDLKASVISQKESTDIDLVQYQMRTFMDDFNNERKEKEELVKQKVEMHGEYNLLMEKYENLQKALNTQSHKEPQPTSAISQSALNVRGVLYENRQVPLPRRELNKSSSVQYHQQHSPYPMQVDFPPKEDGSPYLRQMSVTGKGNKNMQFHSTEPSTSRNIGFTSQHNAHISNIPSSPPMLTNQQLLYLHPESQDPIPNSPAVDLSDRTVSPQTKDRVP